MTQTDQFHQHEALHMTIVCADLFADRVWCSFYVEDNPEIEALCEKAHAAIMAVYQAIGADDGPDHHMQSVNADMLEALQWALPFVDNDRALTAICAAIAKATGEAQ